MAGEARASRLKGAAGAVFCLALTAAILAFGAGAIRDREASVGSDFTLEVPDAGIIPDLLPETGGQDDIPNTVEPESTNALPAEALPADVGAVEDEDAAPAPKTALARPIVLAAGRLTFSGSIVELADIEPVPIERKCKTASGEAWPCGRMARTAFANYVRGRTVECTVPERTWSGTVTARCTLADADLSQWLIENGWAEAEAAAGSELAAIAEEARAAGRGLYGPDLRRDGRSNAAADEPTAAGRTNDQGLPVKDR